MWDVELVLKYIKDLPGNFSLSDKIITQKLTILLVLTAASRSSELKYLDINFMISLTQAIGLLSPKCSKAGVAVKHPHHWSSMSLSRMKNFVSFMLLTHI